MSEKNEELDFTFDKFMDDLIDRQQQHEEQLREYFEGQEELPQRRYNKLYRELPQNRIVYRRPKK